MQVLEMSKIKTRKSHLRKTKHRGILHINICISACNQGKLPVLTGFGLLKSTRTGLTTDSVLNQIHSLMENGQNIRPWRS